MALQKGRAETVTAYVKLLLLLDRKEAKKLLSPPALDGLSKREIVELYSPAVAEYRNLNPSPTVRDNVNRWLEK